MQNIKTIAGTFTIGTYEIPKQYVCAKTPTITQKNDICEIGNKLTEEQQWAKLALVKEIAEEVWK